jgi:heme A synthase
VNIEASGVTGWRRLAAVATVATYLLIILGGIVRITGSGMGCGDDWPLCNGKLIPPMDLPTLIEYGHRLLAAAVGVLVAALLLWAWRRRTEAPWRPLARLSLWALIVYVVQAMLGAVTVWLELPPWSVVLHLGTAMALLALLLVGALGRDPSSISSGAPSSGHIRLAWGLTGLAAVVVLLGALVANLGAASVCQGFPLCNGRWLPDPNWRIHLHWMHRLAAYVLVIGTVALPLVVARARPGSGKAVLTAWLAAAAALGQLIVAAAMVLQLLPDGLRALHVALGAAVFASLFAHVWLVGGRESDGLE